MTTTNDDSSTEGTPPASTAPTGAPPADWTPPASQADLDRIITARLERERAKFNDYDALREKATLWDEVEAASTTEYERTQQALTQAETRYQAAQARVVTAELKAAGVPAELIEDLDLSRFIDGDGEIADDRIDALRTKYAALAPATGTPRMAPNPAQGSSAQPPLSMGERIAQAQAAGDKTAVMRLKAQMAIGTV